MALEGTPIYQRAMQRARAKASMQGQIPQLQNLQAQLAAQDLARRRAFERLGLARLQSNLAHRGRMQGLRADETALKNRRQQLPWEIGIGAGTSLMAALEGQRRAQALRESAEATRDFRNKVLQYHRSMAPLYTPYIPGE